MATIYNLNPNLIKAPHLLCAFS